ncbi:hypothetical protein CALVIDRAFT_532965 [Calocera viscosa TUFC12733]|uniref:Uncharacterized protein n=1 Tax=Calocera viscosa (strain TUFC12733) TaxID=1330018 RepID=A0A167RWC5_CALVF|nr:hypothetical protein CALVIDRAFT_532965 [Calocera viscosa TUFC12733]
MGFFSSRAESAPLPKNHDAKPITSKWYGKLRKKDSPSTSPQPNADGWIEVFPVAPAPGPVARSAPPVAADPVTRTLASRLNELATSHADGLISENEYRILRQDIFERYGSGSQAGPSRLSGSQRTARDSQVYARSPLPSFTPPDISPSIIGPQPPSSPLTVLKNSLRRTASRSSNKSGSILPNGSSSASLFSFRSNSAVTMANSGRNGSSNTLSTQNIPLSPTNNISADLVSISSRRSRVPSVAPTHRSRAAPPSAYHPQIPTSYPSTATLRQTLPDNEEDKSAAQLRRELAEVEMEGMRVLEGFDAREANLLEQLEGMQVGVGLGITSVPAANGVASELPQADSTATIKARKRNSLIDVLPLRSAMKAPSNRTPPSGPTRTTPSISYTPAQAGAVLSALEPDPKLTEALAEVRKSRAGVRQRYEARMAFLRAKLKGAELHEKLIK